MFSEDLENAKLVVIVSGGVWHMVMIPKTMFPNVLTSKGVTEWNFLPVTEIYIATLQKYKQSLLKCLTICAWQMTPLIKVYKIENC